MIWSYSNEMFNAGIHTYIFFYAKGGLVFPPNTLKYGLYRMSMTLQMLRPQEGTMYEGWANYTLMTNKVNSSKTAIPFHLNSLYWHNVA